jgi:hypothetical protein
MIKKGWLYSVVEDRQVVLKNQVLYLVPSRVVVGAAPQSAVGIDIRQDQDSPPLSRTKREKFFQQTRTHR